MQLDHSLFYRKTIVPWYDSDTPCVVVIVGMCAVLVFSMVGVSVAHQHPEYYRYLWLPALLTASSGLVLASTLFRLIRRHAFRFLR